MRIQESETIQLKIQTYKVIFNKNRDGKHYFFYKKKRPTLVVIPTKIEIDWNLDLCFFLFSSTLFPSHCQTSTSPPLFTIFVDYYILVVVKRKSFILLRSLKSQTYKPIYNDCKKTTCFFYFLYTIFIIFGIYFLILKGRIAKYSCYNAKIYEFDDIYFNLYY